MQRFEAYCQNQGNWIHQITQTRIAKLIMSLSSSLIRYNSIVPVKHRPGSFSAEDISKTHPCWFLRITPYTDKMINSRLINTIWDIFPRVCPSLQNRTRNGMKVPTNRKDYSKLKELWPGIWRLERFLVLRESHRVLL